jgi:hypothetical protein
VTKRTNRKGDLQELDDDLELVENIEAIRWDGEEDEPVAVLENTNLSSIISPLTKEA